MTPRLRKAERMSQIMIVRSLVEMRLPLHTTVDQRWKGRNGCGVWSTASCMQSSIVIYMLES